MFREMNYVGGVVQCYYGSLITYATLYFKYRLIIFALKHIMEGTNIFKYHVSCVPDDTFIALRLQLNYYL